MQRVAVIIPAMNEAESIGKVVRDIPAELVSEVVVVNNNSTDDTAKVAGDAGATVLHEVQPGYGFACLKGISYLGQQQVPPDVVVFMDGDYADHPEDMESLLQPLFNGADMVIGSRATGQRQRGSLTVPQRFGNWLATKLIANLYGVHFTDLGPFRAIRWQRLQELNMQDTTYGWTAEMQVKAAKKGYVCKEVPVRYRRRIGRSKVSGTVKGTVMAGYKIIYTIFKYAGA